MRGALYTLLLATVAFAKGDYRAKFELDTEGGAESFSVLVHEDWAPIGAARFKELVMEGFYDDTRFFRVIPGFMAQFGLSGKVETNAKWNAKPIMDEPVKQSNKPGYITFAKTGAPNSRTTQLFINFVDNARLDGMGFAPFGEVEGNGMDVMRRVHNCGEKPNQGQIKSSGNAYLDSSFPNLSKIVRVTIQPLGDEL